MNKYEELLDEATSENISVDEDFPFKGDISGLCIDGNIALSTKLKTSAEKACVLAEELGHYHTSVGHIVDLSDTWNRKQERQARLWAYNRQIGLLGIVKAYEHGCQNCHEIAAYLDVTEEFLNDAIECYRSKYGDYATFDNYIIYFIPNLIIGEKTSI